MDLAFINQIDEADPSNPPIDNKAFAKKIIKTLNDLGITKVKLQLDAGTKKYQNGLTYISSYASIVDGGSSTKLSPANEKDHEDIINGTSGIYHEYFNNKFDNVDIKIEANDENVTLKIDNATPYTIWGFPVNTLVKWYKSRRKEDNKNPISILYSKLTLDDENKDKLCIRFMCTLKMIGDQGQAKYVKAVNDKNKDTTNHKYLFCTRDYLAGIFGFVNDPKTSTLFFKKDITGMTMYYNRDFDATEFLKKLLANIKKIAIPDFVDITLNVSDKDAYNNKNKVIQELLNKIQPNKTLIDNYITKINLEISNNNDEYQKFKMDYLLDPLIQNIVLLWINFQKTYLKQEKETIRLTKHYYWKKLIKVIKTI